MINENYKHNKANGTSTCFKPISFLKYSNKKTFTFNRMVFQHTMRIVFVNGLTSTLKTNGLVDVGHLNGQHVHLIYLQWTFSYGAFLKTWCTKRNHELFLTFAELLLTKLPQLIWNYAKRFVTVLLHDWFPVSNTTGNNLNSLNVLFEHCCNLTSFLLIILLSLFINSSYCACSSHLSYNKIYLNLQLLLI